MKNEQKRKGLKIIMLLLLIVGVIAIIIYPFDNRNLDFHFEAADGNEYVVTKSNYDIKYGDCKDFTIDGLDEIELWQVKIYNKSIYLRTLTYGEFARHITQIENGTVEWLESSVILSGDSGISFEISDELVADLRELSGTLVQERIMLLEVYLILISSIYILGKIYFEKDISGNHGIISEGKRFFRDIKKYGFYMIYSANTDLKAEVANSYLNRLWWLLEPFFNMIVYVLVFGQLMGNNIKNYATFVFSALLMWNFFSKTVNYSVKLVRTNKEIVTKVYIPKFIILLSNMILNFMKLLFSLIVLVIMLIFFRVQIGWNIFWVIPAYIVMMLVAFGCGMIFLHFGVFVDDLSYAVGILLNMLMFISGIFYEVNTTLPEPFNIIMMYCNPVAIVIDTMRNALIYDSAANILQIGIWFLAGLLLCVVGIHTVYKNENAYVKVV
jgi:ABC-type polysaccharide/polyol phosphate export permease